MDINLLVKLTSRAWSLSILSAFHRGTPGRQAALIAASGAGRSAFLASMAHLIELGLVARTPGHGHPLRPEYQLTDLGVHLAQMAQEIMDLPEQKGPDALLRRAWTAPILAVTKRASSFADVKARLPRITDRALSQSLKGLEAQSWVDRRVDTAQRPPRPFYIAVNSGAQISRRLQHYLS